MSGMSAFIPRSQLPPEQEVIRAKYFDPTGMFIEFKKDEIELSFPDRFEKIARLYPIELPSKPRIRSSRSLTSTR